MTMQGPIALSASPHPQYVESLEYKLPWYAHDARSCTTSLKSMINLDKDTAVSKIKASEANILKVLGKIVVLPTLFAIKVPKDIGIYCQDLQEL